MYLASSDKRRGSEKLAPATDVISMYSVSDRLVLMDGRLMATSVTGRRCCSSRSGRFRTTCTVKRDG